MLKSWEFDWWHKSESISIHLCLEQSLVKFTSSQYGDPQFLPENVDVQEAFQDKTEAKTKASKPETKAFVNRSELILRQGVARPETLETEATSMSISV